MRNIPSLLTAFFLGMSVVAIISWKTNNNDKRVTVKREVTHASIGNNMIVAIRKIKLKSGASADAFEKLAVEKIAPQNGMLPGYKDYVLKGERGDDAGNYLVVSVFDSKQTRDFYFPVAGKGPSPEGQKLMASLPNYSQEIDKLIQVVPTDSSYTDYIMLYQ